jgi:hypothetical protein
MPDTPQEQIKRLVQKWAAWQYAWRHIDWAAVSPAGKRMPNNQAWDMKHKRLEQLVARIIKIAKEDR